LLLTKDDVEKEQEVEVDFDFEEDKGVFWATIADLFGTFDLAREGTKIK
jgi:hypothetical protein